jgi:hypothetical protein
MGHIRIYFDEEKTRIKMIEADLQHSNTCKFKDCENNIVKIQERISKNLIKFNEANPDGFDEEEGYDW